MSRHRRIIHSVKEKYMLSQTETEHISRERLPAELESTHLGQQKSEETVEVFYLHLEKSAELNNGWFLGSSAWLFHKPISGTYWGAPIRLSELWSQLTHLQKHPVRGPDFHYTKEQKERNPCMALGSFMKIWSITNKEGRSKIILPGCLAATHLSLTRCQGHLLRNKRTRSLGQKWANVRKE